MNFHGGTMLIFISALILWLFFSFLVAGLAKKRGRSFGAFLALSIIFSPLIIGIILLFLGEIKDTIEQQPIEDDSVVRARQSETIHTQEQLIQQADELHIDRSWYSFDGDRTRPVTLSGDTIYYGKSGETICGSKYGKYDIMLKELLAYKENYDYLQADVKYKISYVYAEYQGTVEKYYKEQGKVLVADGTQSQGPSEKLINEGWSFVQYDNYDGISRYNKLCGEEMLQHITIVFNKKTDQRDRDTFSFTKDAMITAVSFPVPEALRAEIFKDIAENPNRMYYPKSVIDDKLAMRAIEAIGGMDAVIEQEYTNLIKYSDLVRSRLFAAAKKYAQENAGAAYNRSRFIDCIAKQTNEEKQIDCRYEDSRSNTIYNSVFDEIEAIIQKGGLPTE